ncbi:MAG: hypothetical protein Q7R35_07605 [Elusimicrobiota bacterium]|nr:hypothetical protein [Elusimicrobiota bacterium]
MKEGLKTFLRLLAVIAAAEFAVMFVVAALDTGSAVVNGLFDALLLSLLVSPFLYLLVARRMDSVREEYETPENLGRTGALVEKALEAVPSVLFVVDEDMRVFYCNRLARELIADANVLARKLGDVARCVNSTASPDGCGRGPRCHDCVVRNSVKEVYSGRRVFRKQTVFEHYKGSKKTSIPLLITAAPLSFRDSKLALLILEDIADLTEARALLPICAGCKSVRNESDYWQSVESYIGTHLADIKFSHGLCPKCIKKLYPQFTENDIPPGSPEERR